MKGILLYVQEFNPEVKIAMHIAQLDGKQPEAQDFKG